MKRLIFVALGAAALSGCTGTHIKPPAVCDGKHRRPANLYGSILPTLPVPLPPSQSGGQSMVAPPAAGAAAAPAVAVPAPSPAPTSQPAPDAGSGDGTKTGPGAMNTQPPAPRMSKRDIALSYLNC